MERLPTFFNWHQSVPIDLNGDGTQAGDRVGSDASGAICSTGYPDGYPAVADLDGDGKIEMSSQGMNTWIFENCALSMSGRPRATLRRLRAPRGLRWRWCQESRGRQERFTLTR